MTQIEKQHDGQDWIGMWDRSNPCSVWSRVPGNMRDGMDAIPEKIRFMPERSLFKKGKPPRSVQDARHRFWEMYRLHDTRRISIAHAFNNQHASYRKMLEVPERLMWFLTPPLDLMQGQKSVLERAMELVRDALDEKNLYIVKTKTTRNAAGDEVTEETRELNTKAMSEVRKLMGEMTDRIHGTAIQRIAHAHTVAPAIDQMDATQILEAAEADTTEVELDESLRNDEIDESQIAPIEADLEEFMVDDLD